MITKSTNPFYHMMGGTRQTSNHYHIGSWVFQETDFVDSFTLRSHVFGDEGFEKFKVNFKASGKKAKRYISKGKWKASYPIKDVFEYALAVDRGVLK